MPVSRSQSISTYIVVIIKGVGVNLLLCQCTWVGIHVLLVWILHSKGNSCLLVVLGIYLSVFGHLKCEVAVLWRRELCICYPGTWSGGSQFCEEENYAFVIAKNDNYVVTSKHLVIYVELLKRSILSTRGYGFSSLCAAGTNGSTPWS